MRQNKLNKLDNKINKLNNKISKLNSNAQKVRDKVMIFSLYLDNGDSYSKVRYPMKPLIILNKLWSKHSYLENDTRHRKKSQ